MGGVTGKKHVKFESDYNTREGDSKSYARVGPRPSQHLLVSLFPPFPAAKVVNGGLGCGLYSIIYSQNYSTSLIAPPLLLKTPFFKTWSNIKYKLFIFYFFTEIWILIH